MDMTTRLHLRSFRKAVKEIADATSHDLTLRQLMVLLSVGEKTMPVNQQVLVDEFDSYKSTMSKIVAALSGEEGDVRRPDGYGMLAVNLDTQDLRGRVITPSKTGDKVLSRAMKLAFATPDTTTA